MQDLLIIKANGFNIPNYEHRYVNMIKQMIPKKHSEHFISYKIMFKYWFISFYKICFQIGI